MRKPVKYLLIVLCGVAALAAAFVGMLMLPLLWQPKETYRSEALTFRLVVQRDTDVWSSQKIRHAMQAFDISEPSGNPQIVWRQWEVSMPPPPEVVQRREDGGIHVALSDAKDTCLLHDKRFPSWEILSCRIGSDYRGRPALDFRLSPPAAKALAELTERYSTPAGEAGRRAHLLAIIIDGKVCSAARIETRLGEHFQLTGDWSMAELSDLRNRLVSHP